MKRTRTIAAGVGVAALLAAGWTGWTGWQAAQRLQDARDAVRDLRAAVEADDADARSAAADRLIVEARGARAATDGPWWGALGHLPVVGDDLGAVSALSASLDELASIAVPPLLEAADLLPDVQAGRGVDLRAPDRLATPVATAAAAAARAEDPVADVDAGGPVGPVRDGVEEYVDELDGLARGLASGETAVAVLPRMLGAEGPRDYLVLFQNNAEIRATGGMPGSFARLHAEDGVLTMHDRGTASGLGERATPVLPLSPEEREVYGEQLGSYFHDVGFTPDFPRAAELAEARWEEAHPRVELDGVLATDPVALSYVMDGTAPVRVAGRTLTADNVVFELLSRPYLELAPESRDLFFARAAGTVLDAITGDVTSPMDFVGGLTRAAREGRFLVAVDDPTVSDALAGTAVEGALTGDDGDVPHVDVDVNDATGSKMSYYLRHDVALTADACAADGSRTLTGAMTLRREISPAEAAKLPPSVTGGGHFGTEPGTQLLLLRLHAPCAPEPSPPCRWRGSRSTSPRSPSRAARWSRSRSRSRAARSRLRGRWTPLRDRPRPPSCE
ncbi:DUF4012 domain-containing protein [Nocardioides sp. B-3]|uniref:DUF4012 domain-containing protein n=1 Tax=Nocardioides sp. B-3 TaxID=2895565 RepID=UPI00215257A1|nr:DUF4012 domain-containing protein [Nocardioides sp. B-3]UUZ57643.1 DUF4012 domain-containing protein [Nocardioides sp. B-3]